MNLKSNKLRFSLIVTALTLAGCATPIRPQYVSPVKYQSLNCGQLQSEYDRLQRYVVNGVEPETRSGVAYGVGIGGFGWGRRGWGISPSISVGGGQSSTTQRTEKSRLLGEQDAIVQQANFKGCRIATVDNSKLTS